MMGIFNSFNFNVLRGAESVKLSKLANIPYSELEYGLLIKKSAQPVKGYIDIVSSSFGMPSFTVCNAVDGPVDCWVITSLSKGEIIYIEYWEGAYPERMYIFFNVINNITCSFLKYLYEKVCCI